MRRFLRKKLFIAGLAFAAVAAFAGTCTITNISLTPIGTNAVFAGAVQNNSGANILQHNVLVAFLDSGNNVLETKTVQPCLRTLPNGGTDYFSSTSSYSSATVATGLARVPFDATFKVGTAAVGSGTISNLSVTRNGTTLTVTGTFTNTDATTLTAPNACAVVFNSSGGVVVVGIQQTMPDLAQNGSATFTVSMQVPDSTTTVSYVNVYVDGFKAGVPTLPVAQAVSNTPVLATPTPNATPGAAYRVAFTTQPPANTLYNTPFANSITVDVQDQFGTTVTSSVASVTLTLTANASGGILSCTSGTTVAVAAGTGRATFTGCKVDKAQGFYTLNASSGSLIQATSNTFNITPGPITTLNWTTQPSASVVSGSALSAQPVLTAKDAGGNVVWNDNSTTVTLAITLPNTPGGVLTCTGGNVRTLSAGVATFSGCSISKVGSYTLTGTTSGAITSPASTSITVVPQVVFTTQPSGAASNVAFAMQPVVTLRNGDGTTVTGDSTSTILLSFTAVSGGPGTFSCTTNPVTVSSGVATFAGCKIVTAGTYTLTATSSIAGTLPVTSVVITIT